MPRAKGGVKTRRRHNSVLNAVKGHVAARSRRYKAAHESWMHALAYSTIHRRTKKREMRALAILRINAAARQNGLTYGQLVHGLKLAGTSLDRKSLSELAVREPAAFGQVVGTAKSALGMA
jgi:large subunit ribosomal protein L20